MAIRLQKLKETAEKFFSKTYPNIEFQYTYKNDDKIELLTVSCSLSFEEVEDILVNIYVNPHGLINLEATFGEVDKDDINLLTLVNEYNSNEPVGKVYVDDYLNLCLGTTGIDEMDAVETMNNMLDYFASLLDEDPFKELLTFTY